MRVLYLLACMGLAVYGLYCTFRMHAFIGTGHYWSNPWFYKGHAVLFALIVIRMLTPAAKGASDAKGDK